MPLLLTTLILKSQIIVCQLSVLESMYAYISYIESNFNIPNSSQGKPVMKMNDIFNIPHCNPKISNQRRANAIIYLVSFHPPLYRLIEPLHQ